MNDGKENNFEEATPAETKSEDTAKVEEAVSYDTSVQYSAAVISDGDWSGLDLNGYTLYINGVAYSE